MGENFVHTFEQQPESWLKVGLLFGGKCINQGMQPGAPGLAGLRHFFLAHFGQAKAFSASVRRIHLAVYQPAFHQVVNCLRCCGFGEPEVVGDAVN